MGSMVALKFKIMPASPNEDLNRIEKESEEIVVRYGGRVYGKERENIAFGLVAILLTVGWEEKQDSSILELEIRKIKGVQSAEIIDIRRGIG